MRTAAQGEIVDYAYQVRLSRDGQQEQLLRALDRSAASAAWRTSTNKPR
jgi:hypothetical protein